MPKLCESKKKNKEKKGQFICKKCELTSDDSKALCNPKSRKKK